MPPARPRRPRRDQHALPAGPAKTAAIIASRYVSRARGRSSGSSCFAALSRSGGASLPCLEANAICPRSRSTRARWSSSRTPASAVASRPLRRVERAGLQASLARRRVRVPHAAPGPRSAQPRAAGKRPRQRARREPVRGPPNARARRRLPRPGPGAARARCHARRSGPSRGRSLRRVRDARDGGRRRQPTRYAADRTSGCANSTRPPILSSPASTAASAAAMSTPEHLGRTVEQHGVAERLRGRDEDE